MKTQLESPTDTEYTLASTVARLCRDVDYWKAKAEQAQAELRQLQEQQIRNAGLWDSYQETRAVFGFPIQP